RVIAVGTTTVRTLESLYHAGCLIATGRWDGEVPQWYPYEDNHPDLTVRESLEAVLAYLDKEGLENFVADTRIIIAPGYKYRIVKGMVTNFHQPRSTLLLLVSAFMGDAWKDVYKHALEHEYRFLSYGDACLFV
ncbi:MAG: S-adenosylmethionine:tRNA ribosyltransferase-isomerase, partial [Muribaculaceae bacterium]|nr:S-adenosylmethionine:tRNA ribosyltransferase-isomerase [Muribaculaceae bacterium]